MIADSTPILIGAAQVVLRDITRPEEAKAPVELAAEAVNAALANSKLLASAVDVDTLVMTRLLIDSAEALKHPFGNSDKPPVSVARLAELSPSRIIYGPEGGQSPQRLVNEFAESIHRGDSACVVICGAEATAAMKQALKHSWQLHWRDEPEGEMEDRGFKPLSTELERRHHITFPPQVYALFENAWRYAHGLSVAQHQVLMGKLFARFSEIAAQNPYAQFPVSRSAEFLATASNENYIFAEPYNKWMVAQDAVNQAAALVLTSVGKARELGIPESQWVYLHGYGDADDTCVSQRASLSSSIAMKAASQTALSMAGKGIDDITLIDLYSCFPIAVLAACDALGIPWDGDRDLTVTGGLPFFGGPGNSYSVHAIAEIYDRLVANPGEFGLVSANGGYLSKESVGIYSTTPCENWAPAKPGAAQAVVDECSVETVVYPYSGEAVIESYCVVYKKSVPAIGFALCRESVTDARVFAKVATADAATLQEMLAREPIGRRVYIETGEHGGYFQFTM